LGLAVIWQSALFDERLMLQSYLVYNGFLLVGVLFGMGTSRESHGLDHNGVVANRRSLRQMVFGLICAFLALFVAQDHFASRSFLFSYVPWFYSTLLCTNYMLPRSLGTWSSSGEREERVALVGTAEQAWPLPEETRLGSACRSLHRRGHRLFERGPGSNSGLGGSMDTGMAVLMHGKSGAFCAALRKSIATSHGSLAVS
jgi:hypothetical protein